MTGWWTRAGLDARLGVEVRGGRRIAGGDVAEAWALDLADGRTAFAKTLADPPPGMFTTEASDLRWLADARALPVPAVLAADDATPAHLVLEWVDEGGRTRADEAAFGRGLATLHAVGADTFGRTDGRTTGSLAVPNDPCGTWAAFFAERRLRPLARSGRDRGALPDALVRGLEDLADAVDRLDVPVEPPARLHGDLWAGNRVVDATGASWLIDPQAHGGHREADLAMMALFGGFDAVCWAAYDEVHPLADGWRDRVALHQIPPLAVHAIRFGGSYVARTQAAVDRYR
ncbi:fructosamine kinase family protein [Euzebya sp.]|uniref:fructosamine kinase family protein n=1 Tax=Euzebya sp. TaxID=1971409 RepID=UPI003517F521